MNGRTTMWAIALAIALAPSAGAVVNVQLNLRYTDPADEAAGGTWELLAGSTDNGIAGLTVLVEDINNDAAVSASAGFEVFESQQVGTVVEIVIGSDLQPPLDTDIGLGAGTTGNVEDDLFPGNSPAIWANNALLSSGTFGASRPEFLITTLDLAAGVNVFNAGFAVAENFGTLAVRGDGVDSDGLQLGDANRDGVVDLADLFIVNTNLGQNGGWDQGDFNSDGIVNNTDLVLQGIVPEPTTMALVCLAAIGSMGMRRRN